jgi:2-oxoisovalerate ferredoxin oxidoreductase beta subunit
MPHRPEETVDGYEVIHSRSEVFYDKFERKSDLQHQTHYCPGCGHGAVHKLVAEALEDMGVQDRTIFVSPVGCSVFAYYYFDVGNVQAAHGRTPAVATALKRANPGSVVIGYQGDGDLAAIGTAEILHAANRGEKITIIFINNAIYGMTGGQMAPTTLIGQKSTTSPFGRRAGNEGYPLHMSELIATLEAPIYVERVALSDNKNIMKARRAVRKALELQRDGAGFSFVEILSPCPTIWKLDPRDAKKFVAETMIPTFPLGVFKDKKPVVLDEQQPPQAPLHEVLRLEAGIPVETVTRKQVTNPRKLTLKVAGFGGQGVLLLGQILAEMGLRDGFEVSWLPSYGPEMRSGSAHCHVCLAEERIGSPLISQPNVLIAMNEISLRKFAAQVPKDGLILYNRAALPEGFHTEAKVICVPASDIADQLGAARVANVVMLGALLAQTDVLKRSTAEAVLAAVLGAKNAKLMDVNLRALESGAQHAANLEQPVAV